MFDTWILKASILGHVPVPVPMWNAAKSIYLLRAVPKKQTQKKNWASPASILEPFNTWHAFQLNVKCPTIEFGSPIEKRYSSSVSRCLSMSRCLDHLRFAYSRRPHLPSSDDLPRLGRAWADARVTHNCSNFLSSSFGIFVRIGSP